MGLGQVSERKISSLNYFLGFWFLLILGYQLNDVYALVLKDGALSLSTLYKSDKDFKVQFHLINISWISCQADSQFVFQSFLFLLANWGLAKVLKLQKTSKDLLKGFLGFFLLLDALNFYFISSLSGKAFDAFEYYGATVLDFFRIMPVLPLLLQWFNDNSHESN